MTHSQHMPGLAASRTAILTEDGGVAAPMHAPGRNPADFTGIGPLPLGPPTGPGKARGMRAALPRAVREKLERIEVEAETACVRARTLADQARAAYDEQQRLARRLEELRATHPTLHPGSWVRDPSAGPSARRWQPAIGDNLDDLKRELDQTTTDIERLTHERDAAQERWNALGQLVARCRTYLGM